MKTVLRVAPRLTADRGMGEPISLGASLVAGKKPPPEVTLFLMQDHQTAFDYSDWYEGSRDPEMKKVVGRWLCVLLRAHQQIEEELLYPAAAKALGDDELIKEAEREHAEARKVLEQAEAQLAKGKLPDEAMQQLRTLVQQHVEEEEGELFPRLRETDLDLHLLGAQLLARRLELLWELTGRSSKHELKETGKMPIDTEEARRMFVAGLRDMHATAAQGREMIERQVDRLEHYPQVEARLRAHLEAKKAQTKVLEEQLEELGESNSSLKDLAMKTAGNISAMLSSGADDEIHKNSLALSGLTQFSISSLESLITIGTAADLPQAVKELQKSLAEERSMAAWLAGNLRGLVVMDLQRRSEGKPASH